MISTGLSVGIAIAAGLLALALAVVVLVTAPERRVNRLLAVALVCEAVALSGARLALVLDFPWNTPLGYVTPFAVGAYPFIYLLILSILQTPLVRWLRPRGVRWLLGALAVMVGGLSALAIQAMRPAPDDLAPRVLVPWAIAIVLTVYALIALITFFAFVAALDAVRRAPVTSTIRRRAKAFALSFGIRDALATIGLGLVVWGGLTGGAIIGREQSPLVMLGEAVVRLGAALAIPLIAYGILRTQLFDIDLHIRWGIKRGTLITILLLAFFITSKIVESYLSRSAGWSAGALAAGVLLFITPRLNKFADQVADAALPGAHPSAEYLTFRKLEVYKATVESALETGPIDAREREMLQRLQAKLALNGAIASAIEADVMGAKSAARLDPESAASARASEAPEEVAQLRP